MTAIALSYKQVRALKPCKGRLLNAVRVIDKQCHQRTITAAQAKQAGVAFDDLVWVASAVARTNKNVERRLRLWAADCAARVLRIYEKDCPADQRPCDAIIAARQFARGEISGAASHAAYVAACDAAWDAGVDAAGHAVWAAAWAAAWPPAWVAVSSAARAAAGYAMTRAAEEAWQFDRLVLRLGDTEPQDCPLSA